MEKKSLNQNNFKKKSFSEKIKYICSIPVKNEGRALDVIFVLCLIIIIALCVFLYRTSTNFYGRLDETMQNNINLNVEAMQNEQIDRIYELLNKISQNTEAIGNEEDIEYYQ